MDSPKHKRKAIDISERTHLDDFLRNVNITPNSPFIEIIQYFEMYLSCYFKKAGGARLAEASVKTYSSCVVCLQKKYADGPHYTIKKVLHPKWLEMVFEQDKQHGGFKRKSDMIRCGLKHLRHFYEEICKIKGFTGLYEHDDTLKISSEPIGIKWKNTQMRYSEFNMNACIQSFKQAYPEERVSVETLQKFSTFMQQKKHEYLFLKKGFKKDDCLASQIS